MRKIRIVNFFLLILLLLSSCEKFENEKSIHKEEFQNVSNITIYYMRNCWCIELDFPKEQSPYRNLICEEKIRSDYDYLVEIPGNSTTAKKFLKKLYSAKEVVVTDNNVKLLNFNGVKYFWQSGIVIDIFYNDNSKEKDVYIMQNGKKVFVKKGKENIYYKMPWQILYKSLWD